MHRKIARMDENLSKPSKLYAGFSLFLPRSTYRSMFRFCASLSLIYRNKVTPKLPHNMILFINLLPSSIHLTDLRTGNPRRKVAVSIVLSAYIAGQEAFDSNFRN